MRAWRRTRRIGQNLPAGVAHGRGHRRRSGADSRAQCAALHVAADLVQGDVRELPFPDESFDIVIDFGTLHHVRPARQALSEVERVLRVGGVLVHETQLSQMLAHPVRSSHSRLQWQFAPQLAPVRVAGFWACRIKEAGPVTGAMP